MLRAAGLTGVMAVALVGAGCTGESNDAYWKPAEKRVDRKSRVLAIVIDEQTCNSGDSGSIPDRLDEIEVREQPGAVVISVAVNAKFGDQTCEGGGPSPPVDVRLPSAIGDRAVIDGVRARVERADDAIRVPAR